MKGLQARVVKHSKMLHAERLDAEYAAHPRADWIDKLSARSDFAPVSDVTTRVCSGHTPYLHDVSEGEVGFVTVECIAPLRFNAEKLKRITKDQYDRELADRQLKAGLVLCTIKRRICQAYPLLDDPPFPAAINQDVAILEPNKRISAAYLATYLSSRVGQAMADRQKTEQMNPYISLDNLRTLPIHLARDDIQVGVERVIRAANLRSTRAGLQLSQAESLLTKSLGLADWFPPEPLTYTASSNIAVSANRLFRMSVSR